MVSQLASHILKSQCKTSKVQFEEARRTCMHCMAWKLQPELAGCQAVSACRADTPGVTQAVQSICQVVPNSGQLMEALTDVAALLAAATDNLR